MDAEEQLKAGQAINLVTGWVTANDMPDGTVFPEECEYEVLKD
jgi:hypothetical protein